MSLKICEFAGFVLLVPLVLVPLVWVTSCSLRLWETVTTRSRSPFWIKFNKSAGDAVSWSATAANSLKNRFSFSGDVIKELIFYDTTSACFSKVISSWISREGRVMWRALGLSTKYFRRSWVVKRGLCLSGAIVTLVGRWTVRVRKSVQL